MVLPSVPTSWLSRLNCRSEIRAEIGFPDTGIADFEYPYLFPAPPNIDNDAVDAYRRDQEQIWYYYSTEITLRRIGNRIMNAIHRKPDIAWLDIPIESMILFTNHFLNQISQW